MQAWAQIWVFAISLSLLCAVSITPVRADEPGDAEAVDVPAEAQEAEPQQPSPGGIEQITVTAEKREATLQETPIAVSAFTGEDLETFNLTQSNDLALYTPGLVLHKASNGNATMSFFGRGMGAADNNPLAVSTVGMYVDGVYSGTGNGALFDIVDVERIEILRGPQGTLFGRNTTGGAVSIISKKPTPEFGYKAKVTLGEDDHRDFRGTLNIPLYGETLLGRFSFARLLRGPFFDNKSPVNGDDFDDVDRISARTALRWLPLDDVTIDYTFDWSSIDEHNPLFVMVSPSGSAVPGVSLDVLRGFAQPLVAPHVRRDNGDIFNDNDTFTKYRIWNHSVQIAWDVGENLQLKSITGWRKYTFNGNNDLDGTDLSLFASGQEVWHRSFMQELQAVGTAFDGKLEYVFGGNWFQEESDAWNYSDSFLDCPGCTGTFPVSQSTLTHGGPSWAWGIFTQLTYSITDRLRLTGGLRYTEERKEVEYDGCFNDILRTKSGSNRGQRRNTSRDWLICASAFNPTGFFGFLPTNLPGLVSDKTAFAAFNAILPGCCSLGVNDTRYDNWSPMARLSYDWTDDVMTYLTWARGFRAGGFNTRPGAPEVTFQPFEPEHLFSWEAGMKSRWFDNRLQVNVAGYYNDFKDQQIGTFVPGGGTITAITNAGGTRIRGWEVEVQARPIDGLDIFVTHAYTNADFKQFTGFNTTTAQPEDQSSFRKVTHNPKRTWSGLVQYTLPAMDWGTLQVMGSFAREGRKSWFGVGADERHMEGHRYTKYDARISLYDAFGIEGLTLSAIGKNLGDRTYKCCQGINFAFYESVGFGEPRHIYFELGYEYGGI